MFTKTAKMFDKVRIFAGILRCNRSNVVAFSSSGGSLAGLITLIAMVMHLQFNCLIKSLACIKIDTPYSLHSCNGSNLFDNSSLVSGK